MNLPAANVTHANEDDSSPNKLVPAANAHFGSHQGNIRETSSTHINDWELLNLDASMRHINISKECPGQSFLYSFEFQN